MTQPIHDDAGRLREDFRQEALASWTEYLRTGRHLTGEEVLDWLRAWGSEEEKPIPESHSP
jgi:predicted transcriptional regulator